MFRRERLLGCFILGLDWMWAYYCCRCSADAGCRLLAITTLGRVLSVLGSKRCGPVTKLLPWHDTHKTRRPTCATLKVYVALAMNAAIDFTYSVMAVRKRQNDSFIEAGQRNQSEIPRVQTWKKPLDHHQSANDLLQSTSGAANAKYPPTTGTHWAPIATNVR